MRGPWRNRMHQLYQEYCYVDELPYKERLLLEQHGGFFDEHYEYKLAKPSPRQVAVRAPLGGDPKAEWGDTPREKCRFRRQNRLPAKIKHEPRFFQPELSQSHTRETEKGS